MNPTQPQNNDVQPQQQTVSATPTSSGEKLMMEIALPVNRNGWAIAAGYVALFSFPFIVPAPIAIVLGSIALSQLRKTPGKRGRGRAWFAIGYGSLSLVLFAVIMISALT